MKVEPREFGKLVGSVYDFEYVGDLLPMHNHTEDTVHITVISKGSFRARGEGWEMELKQGQVVDWEAGQAHELIALENGSRFINILKNKQR